MVFPGDVVNIQLPAGIPFKITLPVATVQVGCVTVPNVGAGGVGGCTLITTFADEPETQPAALVTV